MKKTHLIALLTEQIKDAYSAETQLLKAIPKLRDAATDEGLRAAFDAHLDETEGQVARLEEICEHLGSSPRGHRCKAMAGLIEEGDEVIEDDSSDPAVKDAALICAAQKVEHYEMALYGCMLAYARILSLPFVAERLEHTLDQERAADTKLTEIAEQWVNEAAMAGHA